MHKVLKNRMNQREELIESARKYIETISGKIGPLCAVLIGSVARGDFNLHSDIDILVISDQLPSHPLERSRFLYRYAIPLLDVKGCLPSEVALLKARRNPLILDALAHGIPLADNGFWRGITSGIDGAGTHKLTQ